MIDSTNPLRRSVYRLAVAAAGVVALLSLYLVNPELPTLTLPEIFRPVAEPVVEAVNVTSVLAATTIVAIVAAMRKLPYGMAAALMLCIGSNITGAGIREWASDTSATLLPNGHVVAIIALWGAALLVTAPRFQPVLVGLGFVVVVAVAGAVALVDPISVPGIVASLLVGAIWWALASAVMLYSPAAAERERQRPDTAAIAFSRYNGNNRP
ncbi:hypothetical protein [Rhodococcus sp. NPDC049939]|uniref:hypothetical protein n=1 Tax=Rhodococcus sp. NPDC049939 TaxID=3155511 RepID=UPI0033F46EF5